MSKNLEQELRKKIAELEELNRQKDIALAESHKKIAKLEAEKKEMQLKLNELIEKYENKIEQYKKMQVEKFGKKSEKIKPEDLAINEVEVKKERKKKVGPYQSSINDLKEAFKGEIKEVVIDYNFEENKVDRNKVKEFGYDETYKLEVPLQTFQLVKYVRKKYKDKEHIYESIVDDVFPKSILTPSLAAYILYNKYVLAVPLSRQAEYFRSHNINLSDVSLSNYVEKAVNVMKKLYTGLLDELINNKAHSIHSDETPIKVLDSDKSKYYCFVYTTSFWDNPIYIYEFSETRTTAKLKEHLKDYNGYMTIDGYQAYNQLTENGKLKLQRCFVHVRRYFADCVKLLPAKEKKIVKPKKQ